jgi:starch synthase
MKENSLKIFFLAAEADPFVKVGGLGDVAGSLPSAIQSASVLDSVGTNKVFGAVDIRLALPYHGAVREKQYPVHLISEFSVPFKGEDVETKVFFYEHDGLPVYFISSPIISSEFSVYSSDSRIDLEKYVFFSLASLRLPQILGWSPNIFHANDWHTAIAVYLLSLKNIGTGIIRNMRTIMAVHNLPYMGPNSGDLLSKCGISVLGKSALPEDKRDLPLPMGLVGADHIVTVSPTYAKEIQTPEFGAGLDKFLRSRSEVISGILNGIDYRIWNPRKDPILIQNYDENRLENRLINKLALQREFGLDEDRDIPLLVMVSRLDFQKGMDLLPDTVRILNETKNLTGYSWQLMILGTGDSNIEMAIRNLEKENSDRIRAVIRFDPELSHRVYSGADMILIPSRYEPCGLTQMIAMRYGCVPVARSTGGLVDSIKDFEAVENSTGFLFLNSDPVDFAKRIGDALRIYKNKRIWNNLVVRGMKEDFSWDLSASMYLQLYLDLVLRKENG